MRTLSEGEMWVFKYDGPAVLRKMSDVLSGCGYKNIRSGSEFVYACGKTPVLLAAHADTVHKMPPREVLYDRTQGVLWSPDGLGADDRAGVLGILELLNRGHRPHVLVTLGEESGCTGAEQMLLEVQDTGVLYALELDRRNGAEAVFYGCANESFRQYVLGFGFVEADGIYTDISVICPAWNVAGANLSCGYYNAHTNTEYLKLAELWDTVGRVERMFEALPKKRFAYGRRGRCGATAAPPKALREIYSMDYGRYYGRGYDLTVCVSPDDLASVYGGTAQWWNDWLFEHADELQRAAEDCVWEEIDRLAAPGIAGAVAATE